MSNVSSILQLKNICKNYRQGNSSIKILQDINLDVAANQMIAIIGASGSGKSTLLHIAGLLDYPDSGEVLYPENKHSTNHLIRLNQVGFIYQYHHLLKDFNARENVALPLLLTRHNYKESLAKADNLLVRLGLVHRLYNMPGELSGGEQQRVAIARSLINSPKLILADEPTGNLDPNTADEVYKLFLQVVKEHKTSIIMVTHNSVLANKMDVVYELKNGRLINSKNKTYY